MILVNWSVKWSTFRVQNTRIESGTMTSKIDTLSISERKDALERLLDDFHEWKTIYGSQVPAGCFEPKDRAEVRKKFIADIAKLKE
jgi:hypothetical protein